MKVIAQDDHLTAGAWAACGPRCLELNFLAPWRQNLGINKQNMQIGSTTLFFPFTNSSVRNAY